MVNSEVLGKVLAAIIGQDQNAARVLANAISGAIVDPTPTSAVAAPQAEYNKIRTLHKDYRTAGFSDKSLKVTVKSKGTHDVLVITAANKFRQIHDEIPMREGFRLDRSTLSAQLRLGVLKVVGRTYKTKTPLAAMNLADKTIVPTMKPNVG